MPTGASTGDLKREARRIARQRGHELGGWRHGQVLTMADCTRCGNTLYVEPATEMTTGMTGSGILDTDCPGDTLAKELREIFTERVVFTRTDWTGSSGYVRAYVADRDSIEEITWTIGRVLDEEVSHRRQSGEERYGIRRGGYGYNRALDVLSAAARTVGATFDQGRWREF